MSYETEITFLEIHSTEILYNAFRGTIVKAFNSENKQSWNMLVCNSALIPDVKSFITGLADELDFHEDYSDDTRCVLSEKYDGSKKFGLALEFEYSDENPEKLMIICRASGKQDDDFSEGETNDEDDDDDD